MNMTDRCTDRQVSRGRVEDKLLLLLSAELNKTELYPSSGYLLLICICHEYQK